MSSAVVSSPHHTALGYAEATSVLIFSYPYPEPLDFDGVMVDDTSVLVKYTYDGDATLDGQVDISDEGILATNWQESPRDWYQADFNYDGTVDITDLGWLATNWQVGVGAPLGPQQDPEQSFLDGIAKLGLSKDEISDLLAMLNQESAPAL